MKIVFLLLFSLLIAGCETNKVEPLYVPAGEREYCERKPEAPLCSAYSKGP